MPSPLPAAWAEVLNTVSEALARADDQAAEHEPALIAPELAADPPLSASVPLGQALDERLERWQDRLRASTHD